MKLRADMMINGGTSIYIPYWTTNPEPLKISDPVNYWRMDVYHGNDQIPFAVPMKFATKRISGVPDEETKLYPVINDGHDYSRNVAVLGKLSMEVIQPLFFAQGVVTNYITVIFKTKQEVGSTAVPLASIWVDAPANFDYSQYCIVRDLESIYYVPEPEKPTTRLPRPTATSPIACNGAVVEGTSPTPGTYNRAKISVQGRLLFDTVYGFDVRIRNAPIYTMSSRGEWKIWTYENAGTEPIDATEFS